jgi:hypothetical protein
MWRDNHYVAIMSANLKNPFAPCISTRGTQVPSSPEWFHEIKQDGAGTSRDWIKVKNPKSPAMNRAKDAFS